MADRITILGAGWSGLTAGYLLQLCGYDVTVIEKEPTLGGHSRSTTMHGVIVDSHGPHLFHCKEEWLWRWVTSFTPFRWYTHRAVTMTDVGMFRWPMTWEVVERHPERATILQELSQRPQDASGATFEAWCVSLVGPTLYKTFIEGYTRKMWGTTELDTSFAPKRIEFRTDNNANYFTDRFQGVPILGYNAIFDGLAARLNVKRSTAGTLEDGVPTIVTIPPDVLLEEKHGRLPYRGLTFSFDLWNVPVGKNVLPAPQVNYTTAKERCTRRTEPRQTTGQQIDKSLVVTETPGGDGRYYPFPSTEARAMHALYKEELEGRGCILAGRLGNYKYYNMCDVIDDAFATVARITGKSEAELQVMALKDRMDYPSNIL
jgi:UDP-galactopyranose mutase